MKLSMHIISNWLSDIVIYSNITDGECVLTSCALSDLDEGLSSDCLYIGTAAIHPEYSEDLSTVVLRTEKDVIAVRAANQIDIYKQVMDAFLFYNQWESELKDAVIEQSSFQRLVEIAYAAICTDIIMFSWNGKIMASVRAVKAVDLLPEQQSVMEPWLFSKIQAGPVCRKVAQNIIPAGFVELPQYKTIISANVYFSNNSFVLMYFSSKVTSMNKAHLQLVLKVRSILSNLNPGSLDDNTFEPIYSVFLDIIERQTVDEAKLKAAIAFKAWDSESGFILYMFNSHSDFTMKRKSIGCILADNFPSSIVFAYHDSTLMLLPECEREKCKTLLPSIMSYLELSGISSLPFSTWSELSSAYVQNETIIKKAGDRSGVLYACEDYAFNYIVSNIYDQCRQINLVARDVLVLKRYDEENDTELLPSLNTYLKNQSNMTASAEELYIHLSSMKYRMKKIRSLIKLDLDKYEDRMFLLFSSEIVLNEAN